MSHFGRNLEARHVLCHFCLSKPARKKKVVTQAINLRHSQQASMEEVRFVVCQKAPPTHCTCIPEHLAAASDHVMAAGQSSRGVSQTRLRIKNGMLCCAQDDYGLFDDYGAEYEDEHLDNPPEHDMGVPGQQQQPEVRCWMEQSSCLLHSADHDTARVCSLSARRCHQMPQHLPDMEIKLQKSGCFWAFIIVSR